MSYLSAPIKTVVSKFGVQSILVYIAVLLKKRIVVVRTSALSCTAGRAFSLLDPQPHTEIISSLPLQYGLTDCLAQPSLSTDSFAWV